jgi:hypothetical protein
MLKIELENESGAELRREVLGLLGIVENYVSTTPPCQGNLCKTAPAVESGETEEDETPATEGGKPPRKRRTKAQIEADKAASNESPEPTAETPVSEPEPEPEKLEEVKPPEEKVEEGQKITEQILRMACVRAQDRLGAGEPVVEVLKQFGATNCKDIREEDRRKVFDTVESLGKQSF